MPLSPRLIRRRIKSVTNTRKITRAMELVSASKMRKAVAAVLASRPYAEAAWRAVGELARAGQRELHPLLAERGPGRTLLIVFSSDRGLCGGFNSQLLRSVFAFLKKQGEETDIVAIGRKGQSALVRAGAKLTASFTDLTNNPRLLDLKPAADLAVNDFLAGRYAHVRLAFTDYRSAIAQKPIIRQLLPIVRIAELGEVERRRSGEAEKSDDRLAARSSRLEAEKANLEYVFEPSPQAVLDRMLPRLVEAQIWQALLESSASEHSARMVAMRSASDSAGDMIDSLTQIFNSARQAGITREIAEISSGKAALES